MKTITDQKNCSTTRAKKLGNYYGFGGGCYAGNVYDPTYLCPLLNTMGGGNRQPMIIEKVVDKNKG